MILGNFCSAYDFPSVSRRRKKKLGNKRRLLLLSCRVTSPFLSFWIRHFLLRQPLPPSLWLLSLRASATNSSRAGSRATPEEPSLLLLAPAAPTLQASVISKSLLQSAAPPTQVCSPSAAGRLLVLGWGERSDRAVQMCRNLKANSKEEAMSHGRWHRSGWQIWWLRPRGTPQEILSAVYIVTQRLYRKLSISVLCNMRIIKLAYFTGLL